MGFRCLGGLGLGVGGSGARGLSRAEALIALKALEALRMSPLILAVLNRDDSALYEHPY